MKPTSQNIAKLIFVVTICTSLFFCKKNENTEIKDPLEEITSSSQVSCNINGNAWNSETAVYGLLPFNMKAVISTAKDTSILGLNLTKAQAVVGEITLKPNVINGNNENRIIYYEDGNDKTYCPFEGTINISEISDKRIKGTFNFKAENPSNKNDKIEVTNGEFNVAVTQPKADLEDEIKKQ